VTHRGCSSEPRPALGDTSQVYITCKLSFPTSIPSRVFNRQAYSGLRRLMPGSYRHDSCQHHEEPKVSELVREQVAAGYALLPWARIGPRKCVISISVVVGPPPLLQISAERSCCRPGRAITMPDTCGGGYTVRSIYWSTTPGRPVHRWIGDYTRACSDDGGGSDGFPRKDTRTYRVRGTFILLHLGRGPCWLPPTARLPRRLDLPISSVIRIHELRSGSRPGLAFFRNLPCCENTKINPPSEQ
jgi:hypothetical protein